MASQQNQWCPFTQQLLEKDFFPGTDMSKIFESDISSLFPASRRTRADDLETPDISPSFRIASVEDDLAAIHNWFDEEMDLRRLADIYNWLWMVGRPMPPRPLHQQRLLNREIVITERLDLHLVWTTDRMFIKPLPRFILDPNFWTRFLQCHRGPVFGDTLCSCGGRRERALGLLFSYAALIMHESDFYIAREAHLIPAEVQWLAWKKAVQQLLRTTPIYPWIDRRFHYGELRLSRLNKIYLFWKTPLCGYIPRWNQYGSFFNENFALLASSTVYIAVVLTAMQVGLATEALQKNAAFQSATYGFTIFSIVGPLAAAGLVMVTFCYFFIGNWVATVQYKKQRLKRINSG